MSEPREQASGSIAVGLRALVAGQGLRERLVKASGAALMLRALNIVLGFATTVVLARTLGPDSFGVYAFALAVVLVVGLPAKAGVPQLVTRETARGQASGDWPIVKGVWRWSTAVVLVTSLAMLALAALAGVLFSDHAASERGITLMIGLLMIPLMGLALVRASSLRGLGHTVQGQLPELAIKPLAFLVLLMGALLLGSTGGLTAPWAMALNIAATMLAFVFGALMLRQARPPELNQAATNYESRAWLATIIPMASINAMHLINTQADILLIGLFMESADVGHYKVAAQISLVVAFGLQATKMVVEPYYSRFYHQGEMARLQKLARGASRLNLAVALAVFAPLLILGPELLSMAFGAAFVAAFVPMVVLSAGRLASSAMGSSGHLLSMAGYQNEYARFWAIAAVMNVILNLILIPLLGTTGAAISTAITLLFANGLGWWAARRWIGCDCSPFSLSR
jgi:O-antigen/teichoic acid export membrane protein